jgi:hypothetical protein
MRAPKIIQTAQKQKRKRPPKLPRKGVRCIAPRKNNTICTNSKTDENVYCVTHQYMLNYTGDEMRNLIECSSCHLMHNGNNGRTCDICKKRVKLPVIKKREGPPCKRNGCKNYVKPLTLEKQLNEWKDKMKDIGCKVCDGYTEGCKQILRDDSEFSKCTDCLTNINTRKVSSYSEYCVKCQTHAWKDKMLAIGCKICADYVRGCRNLLCSDYNLSKCTDCLAKINKREIALDKKNKERVKEFNEFKDDDTSKYCNTCRKEHPIESFMGEYGETINCARCRSIAHKAEEKRKNDPKRKEYKKQYENLEHVKQMRLNWKHNNSEKTKLIWQKSRAKRIVEMGEEYFVHARENAKNWRKKNPNKVNVSSAQRSIDPKKKIYYYKHRAFTHNIPFDLTDEQCIKFFNTPCHYCGMDTVERINGIDRCDNSIGYCVSNCVACCTMCNMIKNVASDKHFLEQIEHILSRVGIISTPSSYFEVFYDVAGTKYTDYMCRAKRKKMPFELSEDEFTKIRCMCCYLCGKQMSATHNNGIDRINNNDDSGYTIGNVAPCCGACNRFKKDYDLVDMFEKMYRIYCMFYDDPVVFDSDDISKFVKTIIETTQNAIVNQLKKSVDECYKKGFSDAPPALVVNTQHQPSKSIPKEILRDANNERRRIMRETTMMKAQEILDKSEKPTKVVKKKGKNETIINGLNSNISNI